MMTLYINREVDGCLDLYVTSGTIYRTGGSSYSYNSRDGYKILIGTFRERRDDNRTAEQRAQQAARDWMAVYQIGQIPVQYGNEMGMSYEASPVEAAENKERTMRKNRSSVM
jgi:hypothetical protein